MRGQPQAGKGATVFPQPLGWAAAFDEGLVQDIGVAISDESRAISNNGGEQSAGSPGFLNCWSPNMNLYRVSWLQLYDSNALVQMHTY